jgi:hypothetical protein
VFARGRRRLAPPPYPKGLGPLISWLDNLVRLPDSRLYSGDDIGAVPSSPAPPARCRSLYKVGMSPQPTYPQHMPDTSSDPPVGGCFTGALGGAGTMAGVTVVFRLCHFCLVTAGFYKVSVRSYFTTAGSGQQWREPWPAPGAAGSLC